MKLSTRIKRDIHEDLARGRNIVIMVDCKRVFSNPDPAVADCAHEYWTKRKGCTLLPKESPVVNGKNEIIYHYTSTTYRDWCHCLS